MSKRQLRLNSATDIKGSFNKLLGKKVNVVLNSGTVFFVKVLEMKDDALVAENMRLKRTSIALSDINEIILDTK